jgi:hypothetical protein
MEKNFSDSELNQILTSPSPRFRLEKTYTNVDGKMRTVYSIRLEDERFILTSDQFSRAEQHLLSQTVEEQPPTETVEGGGLHPGFRTGTHPQLRIPTSGAKSCPDGLDYDKTELQVTKDGKGYCKVPDVVGNSLQKLERDIASGDKPTYENIAEAMDIRDLAPTYMTSGQERSTLAYLLGTEQVKDLEFLNSLTHSGIVNAECPPIDAPHLTQSYRDPITKEKSCREPIPERLAIKTLDPTQKAQGLKKGLETYVTPGLEEKLRKPVARGRFACPPKTNPSLTEHITLEDGTGICVQPKTAEEFLLPHQLIYPENLPPLAKQFISEYHNGALKRGFNAEGVRRLNKFLRKFQSVPHLHEMIQNDLYTSKISAINKLLTSERDVKVANSSLWYHARENFPKLVSHHKEPILSDVLRWYNLSDILAPPVRGGSMSAVQRS